MEIAALLVLDVMEIALGAADPRRHAHHQPIGSFQSSPIGPHVLHAGFGVLGDDVGRGQSRRAVEAGGRDRDRKSIETLALALEILAFDHHLLAYRLVDDARRDRVGDGVIPLGLDLFDRRAHADAVDRRVGGDSADHNRHAVFPALGVDDVGEEKGLTLGFVDSADELPAHERMQFQILIDRPVDGEQQVALLERLQMFVQIGIGAA